MLVTCTGFISTFPYWHVSYHKPLCFFLSFSESCPPFLSIERVIGFHIIKFREIKGCCREYEEMGCLLKNIDSFLFVLIFSLEFLFRNFHFYPSILHFHINPNVFHSLYFSDNFPHSVAQFLFYLLSYITFSVGSEYHFCLPFIIIINTLGLRDLALTLCALNIDPNIALGKEVGRLVPWFY